MDKTVPETGKPKRAGKRKAPAADASANVHPLASALMVLERVAAGDLNARVESLHSEDPAVVRLGELINSALERAHHGGDRAAIDRAVDALVKGTLDGIPILAAILATLLVAVAMVTLLNMGLSHLPDWSGAPITLQRIVAIPFRPLLWTMGVPWAETGAASLLMATKTVVNEFVAYLNFSQLPPDTFSPRTRMVLTYALCGFANFGSLGIMIGGLGAMVPTRRGEIVGLGLRTILSGTLATCMSGAVAGALAG